MPKEKSPGKATTRRYSAEEKAAAVRMVRTLRKELGTEHGTIQRVANPLGYGVESVRSWVRQADIDERYSPGVSSEEFRRIKELEQGNRELKRANESLKRAASFFGAEHRPPTQEVVAFIEANRAEFGVEPICTVLPSTGLTMAPSTYYAARSRPPSARAVRDLALITILVGLWTTNCRVYGARKLWKTARRAGHRT
jgi:transposase